MPWKTAIAPTEEPIDLGTIKLHCRIDTDADDALIEEVYLPAARSHLEFLTRRQWMSATLLLALDEFPRCPWIVLPRPPLQSVSSLKYYDGANTLQTWASSNYFVDAISEPGRLVLASASMWPGTYARPNAVQITYVAGWLAAEDMPRELHQALFLLIAHFYERREETVEKALMTIPMGVCALAGMHRLHEV